MRNTAHKLAYGLGFGLWWLVSLLPLRVLYVFSDVVYLLVGRVVRYRHKVIWNNLTSAFPEKSHQELLRIERKFYRGFCDYIFETLKMMTMSEREMRRRMEFRGVEAMQEQFAKERSGCIFLGHMFNWEWITSLPYWIPDSVKCCQLYHPIENAAIDRLFKVARERRNATCVPMQESLRKILQFKRERHQVLAGYIADQVPLWRNIHHWVDFLCHDTPVFTGSERIARHTDQVCWYGDVRRVSRGHYVVDFKLITEHPGEEPEFAITDRYFQLLEENIRRQPELWLWSHNRWKRTREEFNRLFEVVNGKVTKREELKDVHEI